MKEEVVLAALAGLLHDVGKLEQRANPDPWKPAGGYEDIHPVHASWTASFIQAYVPKPYQGALHGAYHHRPGQSQAENQRLGWLVALADKLSAGERADAEEDEQGKKRMDPPQQLRSIFSRLFSSKQKRYLPLKPLSLDRETLFASETPDPVNRGKAYEELRDALRAAAKQAPSNAEAYLEHLLSAMQRYTWCIPSAYYHSEPDVSLYDHARMTAALAVCLTEFDDATLQRYHQAVQHSFEKKETAADQDALRENVALLIGGDISGIQDFIYTISAQHAAKTLRGRSFYLQLLTEALLRAVLRDLELPYTNVIYSGGGHFFLLAPRSAQEKLPALRKQLSERLFAAHGAALYLALDAAEVPLSGFRLGQFPHYWDRMHAALAQRKQHKYAELGDALYATVFAPKAHGGNREHLCSVCGVESEHVKPIEGSESEGQAGGRICPLCRSFDEQIGKRLPNARFVVLGISPFSEQEAGEGALDLLAGLGLHVRWLEADNKISDLPAECERAVLWAFDDPKDGRWPTLRLPTVGWLHYAVNQIPQATFDELARRGEGIDRLGVLRMDVDGLGTAFKTGFGAQESDSIASLARLSALSFHVSLFFDGWVKKICENYPDSSEKRATSLVYSVYAGGDDLFLIAPWQLVPGLAKKIAEDLNAYTGGQLHLSGGMAFIHGKYPVHQAAKDAEQALDAAKAHEGKNAFGFLGEVWGWEEFALLEHNFETLKKMVQNQNAPQDILQLVQTLGELQRKNRTGKRIYGPWMWMAEYHLRRRQDEAQSHDPALSKALAELSKQLQEDNYAHLSRWSKAARWAQLITRKTDRREGANR